MKCRVIYFLAFAFAQSMCCFNGITTIGMPSNNENHLNKYVNVLALLYRNNPNGTSHALLLCTLQVRNMYRPEIATGRIPPPPPRVSREGFCGSLDFSLLACSGIAACCAPQLSCKLLNSPPIKPHC
jgi:hypothetical protein